ncbi:ABC transporter domain-containing protein, partial [Piedraia hortae CBS 480.64]
TIASTSLTTAFPDGTPGLHAVSLSLPAKSRTLLVGANGAGKTTLLRHLAGKSLSPRGSVSVSGRDPFGSYAEGITYVGLEFALDPATAGDVSVSTLLKTLHGVGDSAGKGVLRDRTRMLLKLLSVPTTWHLARLSTGEKRRVQLLLSLIPPFTVLFLDEVTADLDILMRKRLLDFLKEETLRRDCSVVYATNVFDQLQGWADYVVRLRKGRVRWWGECDERIDLGGLVLGWLEEDYQQRKDAGDGKEGEMRTYPQMRMQGRGGYGLE